MMEHTYFLNSPEESALQKASVGGRNPFSEISGADPASWRAQHSLNVVPVGASTKEDQTELHRLYGSRPSKKVRDNGAVDLMHEQQIEHAAQVRAECDFGFPTFRLKETMRRARKEPEWVVPGYVPRGEVCIFAAEAGLGKTTFLEQMLLSVATGQPFLGLPVEAGTAIGLFHEDPMSHLCERFDALFKERSTDIDSLDQNGRLRFEGRDNDPSSAERRVLWDGGPTRNFSDLERKIEYVGGVKLLVLDTLKQVFIGDVDKGDPVRHFLTALQGLADRQKIAIVGSTHLNRRRETAGSLEFENQGRSVFHLTNLRHKVALTSTKLNCGPEPKPIPLEKSPDGFWRPRVAELAIPDRVLPAVVSRSREERLREIFFDAVDNHPTGLFVSKNAKNYGPRFVARLPAAKAIKASLNEFEKLMEDGLRTGDLAEERKNAGHTTRKLCVVDKPV